VTILIQRGGVIAFERLPFSLRVYTASVSAITYIEQMIWPRRLAPFYPLASGRLSILVPALASAAVIFVTYKAWTLRREHPYLMTGWFWYLGMLVPVIGLIQVGIQAHADRYTYLPHIGLYLTVSWAFAELVTNSSYRFAISLVSAAALIIALSCLAWKQASYWKNSELLWTHTLAVTSRNDVAHHSLGVILLQGGRLDESIANLREALEIRGDNAKAHACLAIALSQKGKADESFLHWQEALRLQPRDVFVRDNFAVALVHDGRPREAEAQWEQSLKFEPNDVEAQKNLAWVLATAPDASLRNGARAVQLAEYAVQLPGQNKVQIFRTLAAAYAEAGRFSVAIHTAERGLQLATQQKSSALADDLRKDISLFKNNIPLRDRALGTNPPRSE
jgi:protein O-mannosyl-transferase